MRAFGPSRGLATDAVAPVLMMERTTESAPAPRAVGLVELRGLSRTYGTDPPVHALCDVDLSLPPRTSVAIVGPSGSGKSTLMNILGCLDRPTAGAYLFEGVDVAGLTDGERAAMRAERIGFVFQSFNLLAHRTVLENVMLAEVYRGTAREGREERAMESLDRVGMTHRAGFVPTRLSGGEQQRAAVARALMGEHSLLLCDEPTGNLDSHNTDSILNLFDGLADTGLTLVVVTHEEHVAERMRRRVRMKDGVLTEER